ncbi:MAG: T9SS type A sorting domain-containing protein [Bacteroidia bacterium]|jgi:hypothetical protein|nr:T9SS type A sorting domain-containing protein [Bacteroidia bacterium]
MKTLLKKLLSPNKPILFGIFIPFAWNAQVNLVSNGSFENIINCNSPFVEYKAIGWSGVDSAQFTAHLCNIVCGNAPNTPVGYQMPKEGNGFVRSTLYCPLCGGTFTRSNLKNRLKSPLRAGKTYCAGMYVNRQEDCPKAIDGFGLYFGDSTIDTIIYNARLPLTFLTPQVKNPDGNIINDAVNWIPVSGTFVANGGEKYLVIGNFKSDATTSLAPTGFSSPIIDFSEYFVDQVSCVELDSEFAGRDTTVWSGDSLFIGKTNDDAWLEAKFIWYKLPGTVPIDSTTGFWVKPVGTGSYVVKQEICGYTIWDTIVIGIKEDDVWLAENKADFLKIFPVPTKDYIELRTEVPHWYQGLTNYTIINNLGQEELEGEINLSKGRFMIDISSLKNGTYSLQLFGEGKQKIVKRIVKSG